MSTSPKHFIFWITHITFWLWCQIGVYQLSVAPALLRLERTWCRMVMSSASQTHTLLSNGVLGHVKFVDCSKSATTIGYRKWSYPADFPLSGHGKIVRKLVFWQFETMWSALNFLVFWLTCFVYDFAQVLDFSLFHFYIYYYRRFASIQLLQPMH